MIICLMRSGLDIMFCTKGFSMIWESISGLDMSCRCICCWSSMKLAEPIPRLPSPAMPPKPAGEGTTQEERCESVTGSNCKRGQAQQLNCIPTNPEVSCVQQTALSKDIPTHTLHQVALPRAGTQRCATGVTHAKSMAGRDNNRGQEPQLLGLIPENSSFPQRPLTQDGCSTVGASISRTSHGP